MRFDMLKGAGNLGLGQETQNLKMDKAILFWQLVHADVANYNNIFRMPKDTIYLEMNDDYPFAQNSASSSSAGTVQVKKSIDYDLEARSICKQKIRMLKSLGFQNLIGLESSKSEELSVILIFQYVPFQFLAEVNALSQEKMNKIYEGMLELCGSLSAKGIVHDLDVKRVGLDKRYNLKYYLGIDFKIDKTVDRQKILEDYKNQVTLFFNLISKGVPQPQPQNHLSIPEIKITASEQNNSLHQQQFEISVNALLGNDDASPKKVMKKSSILASNQKDEDLKPRKDSNRFTFNNDNHIRLPINDRDGSAEQKSTKSKNAKPQDLLTRISALKSYMKAITVKVGMKITGNNARNDESNCSSQGSQAKNPEKMNNFSKFEKKVAELRESKLRRASNDQNGFDNDSEHSEVHPMMNNCKSLQQAERMAQTEKKFLPTPESKSPLFNTMNIQSSSQCAFAKKNSMEVCVDDRQHKEYIMLANKDKYCQQFMNFLQDSEACQQAKQGKRKANQNERAYASRPKHDDEQCKQSSKRQNLKTQSSENTFQIQNRVQKVIRSSLRLISGLRSRQSIRCE